MESCQAPCKAPWPNRPKRGALAAALLATLPCTVFAAQIDYQIGVGAIRSDNIGLAAIDPQKETVVMPQLRFGIEQSGSMFSLSANGQVQYLDYRDDSYDDGFRGAFTGQALWTLMPERLEWTIENYLSLQPIDTFTAFSPGNEQQTNVFVTGPTLLLRAADATRGQMDLRYTNSYAEENATFNSDRYSIAARVLHDLSSTRTISANLEALQVRYESVVEEANYTRYDAYGRYWSQLRDVEMTIDLGYSTLKYEGIRKDESCPLTRANLGWQASPRSTLDLAMNYGFSDAAESMIMANNTGNPPVGTPPGSPSPPIVAGVYKERGIRLRYQFTGERLGFELHPYYMRLDYLELANENEKDWGSYASISYRLRPRTTLQLATLMKDRKFEAPVRRYRDTTSVISLENEFSTHWIGRIEFQRRERDSTTLGQEYQENATIVSFSYRR